MKTFGSLSLVVGIMLFLSFSTIKKDEGIITHISKLDFEQTYSNLRNAIDKNPNLKIIAELDHQANAASVDMKLNPSKIIMFGNPKMGSPLMQSTPAAGLDLPQKMLVYKDDKGRVKVAYNDPLYLKDRHHIKGNKDLLKKMSGALSKLCAVAIGK